MSLLAKTGLQFGLNSAQGKFIASLTAALAEFERGCTVGRLLRGDLGDRGERLEFHER